MDETRKYGDGGGKGEFSWMRKTRKGKCSPIHSTPIRSVTSSKDEKEAGKYLVDLDVTQYLPLPPLPSSLEGGATRLKKREKGSGMASFDSSSSSFDSSMEAHVLEGSSTPLWEELARQQAEMLEMKGCLKRLVSDFEHVTRKEEILFARLHRFHTPHFG